MDKMAPRDYRRAPNQVVLAHRGPAGGVLGAPGIKNDGGRGLAQAIGVPAAETRTGVGAARQALDLACHAVNARGVPDDVLEVVGGDGGHRLLLKLH